ncbi:Asp-tRNA(Asn)/Glu-tRNA(Gln) amidotransferase subunit GatB [Salinibius halmophilus]|uniref:Asp-tRNA(Asn)/Glu-tRNA(Gln) amidotransferase subunit GatB n=1 Tax=Salinibius halmophilus TaxID=1853216 RepID=UPI000E66A3AC|nr:Asp-tRNA(Asn)/Glu-tRNA(Gln) amidotransferase subunit GatB [Salinibius halmophilus]
MEWEIVIGLEIHVQLSTDTKIFSGTSTAFGQAPNTQASAICLAMPGVLPVFNEKALFKAVQFGLAIDAEIGKTSRFDRKNYFYPDSPKGYQITQMDYPIVGLGEVEIVMDDGSTRKIGVTRAHLEEDAGKSLHEDFEGMSGIDLNRAGTPLLEIVSEPDLRSAKEAVAYLKKMHSIITYIGVSDGNMAEGSMRCDANVSVRPKGQKEFGTRTEIKNVNSFRFVEKAINYEVQRHIDIIEDGGEIVQETRLYDSELDETRSMRSKEVANDYRYFPEPDLLPVVIDDEYIEAARKSLPELPDAKRDRFMSEHGLSEYDATVLSSGRAIADYYEAVVAGCKEPKLAANWVMGDLSAQMNKFNVEFENCPVPAEQLALMIARITDETISGRQAKTVFECLWNQEGEVDAIIEAKGLKQVSDTGAIEAIIDEVIANNPGQVEQYRGGKDKLFGFFVGQTMKASKGQANPAVVNELLKKKLDA